MGKLKDFKHLKSLYIEGNRIKNIETLEGLAKVIPGLTTLEIVNNPVADAGGFTDRIWKA